MFCCVVSFWFCFVNVLFCYGLFSFSLCVVVVFVLLCVFNVLVLLCCLFGCLPKESYVVAYCCSGFPLLLFYCLLVCISFYNCPLVCHLRLYGVSSCCLDIIAYGVDCHGYLFFLIVFVCCCCVYFVVLVFMLIDVHCFCVVDCGSSFWGFTVFHWFVVFAVVHCFCASA